MEWLTQSKLYQGSKNKEKILAAFKNPVNQPLVKQLTSYVDEEYIENINDTDEDIKDVAVDDEKDENEVDVEEKASNPSHSSKNLSSTPKPAQFTKSTSSESTETESSEESSETEQGEEKEEVKESINITSSTFVTVDTVSQAVNEIPGLLNIRDDTKGVTYAKLKGGSSNEFWIYFNEDTDINSLLDKVNKVLADSGYYFLEFNRVSRDENAIVFSVNWISNYFNPSSIYEGSDEE